MASNFIPMVYAVLKDKGVDTKDMTPAQAVEKYNELIGKTGRYNVESGSKIAKNVNNKKADSHDKQNRIFSNRETVKVSELFEPKNGKLKKIYDVLGHENGKRIEKIVYEQGGSAKEVYLMCVENTKIANAHYTEGVPHYLPFDKAINFDVESDSLENEDRHAYQVYFHEIGHNIDFISSKDFNEAFSATYKSSKYGGKYLYEVIELEAKNALAEWKGIGSFGESMFIDSIQNIQSKDAGPVQDMMSGLLGIRCNGHDRGYFDNKGLLATEFFAECFSAEFVSPVGVKNAKKFFPKSYEIYEEIKNAILRRTPQ